MPNLNKVLLIGHLGRDAELRYTPGGSAVCNFSIATSEKWTDKATGEKRESTTWHRVNYWGKGAEAVASYLTKGKAVFVEGRIESRDYEKDGQKRTSVEIKADRVQLMGARGEQAEQAQPVGGQALADDDDIPF